MLTNLLVFGVVLTFSLGQLLRISVGDQAVIYGYEILIGAMLLIMVLKKGLTPLLIFVNHNRAILYFFTYLFVSFLISLNAYALNQNLIALLYFIRLIFYFFYFAYILDLVNRYEKYRYLLGNGFYSLNILVIIFSTLQYVFYPDLRNLFYLGWDQHLYRVFGTFLEPVVTASIISLLTYFVFFNLSTKNSLSKVTLSVSNMLLIILTFARSVYLSFIAVFFAFFIRKKPRYIIYFLILFTISVFIAPKPFGEGVNLLRTSTIASRQKDYIQAFQIWQRHPILGIGYNHIRFEKKDAGHAGASFHSSFAIIAVTGGIIGLILFLLVLIHLAGINSFAKYSILFLSIASLFDNLLLHPFILFILLTGLALTNRPSGKLS